jgi:hypothetical protein
VARGRPLNRQAAAAKGYTGRCLDPDPCVVKTAMAKGIGHSSCDSPQCRFAGLIVTVEDARKTAHVFLIGSPQGPNSEIGCSSPVKTSRVAVDLLSAYILGTPGREPPRSAPVETHV